MELRRKKPHPPHPHPPPAPDYATRSDLAQATNQTRAIEQSDVGGLAARVARLEADITGAGLAGRVAHLEADVTGLRGEIAAIDARVAVLEMLIS